MTDLGAAPTALTSLQTARTTCKLLADAKKPMVIVGQGALAPADGAAVLAAAWRWPRAGALTPEWHGFNVLHTAAARVGALDLGFVPGLKARASRR